jgi:hypothetical protein
MSWCRVCARAVCARASCARAFSRLGSGVYSYVTARAWVQLLLVFDDAQVIMVPKLFLALYSSHLLIDLYF